MLAHVMSLLVAASGVAAPRAARTNAPPPRPAAQELPAAPAERGAALAASGRASEARPLLEQAFQENPDDPTVAYNLGVVRAMTGAHREAIEALESYLLLSPAAENASDVRAQIAALKAKLNPIPAAAKDAVRRGTELVADEKPDEAEAKFREGIELAPQWGAPHYNLGLLHESRGRAGAAVAAYRRFLALGAGAQAAAVEARIARLAPQAEAEQTQRRSSENAAVADWVRSQLAGRILGSEWRIRTVEIADCKLILGTNNESVNDYGTGMTATAPLRAANVAGSTPQSCGRKGNGIVLQFNAPVVLHKKYKSGPVEEQAPSISLCGLAGWNPNEIDRDFAAAMDILAKGCGAVPLPFDATRK